MFLAKTSEATVKVSEHVCRMYVYAHDDVSPSVYDSHYVVVTRDRCIFVTRVRRYYSALTPHLTLGLGSLNSRHKARGDFYHKNHSKFSKNTSHAFFRVTYTTFKLY